MSAWTIHVDRAGLTSAVAERVRSVGPIRLSDMFLMVWNGKHGPSEKLIEELEGMGLSIAPGLDSHGGWEVRVRGSEKAGQIGLFAVFPEDPCAL